TGTDSVSLSRGRLVLAPRAAWAWVWAAGSAGLVAVDDDQRGLWALGLRRGSLSRDGDDTVWLESGTTLEPGRRVTVELVGGAFGGWDGVSSLLPAWLPPLAVRGGEPVDLALPDAGVVAPECAVDEGPEGTEIRGAGRRTVAVRGAFGEVTLELSFARPLAEAVQAAATRLGLEEPKPSTAASDGRAAILDRTARRLVVLQAAHSHEAADTVALSLVPAAVELVREEAATGPFTLVALLGEVQRRDDQDALETLLDALPFVQAEAGMALALTRVWAALWGLGRDPEPVREALARVSTPGEGTRLQGVERELITGDRDAARRLLSALGGGLPGSPSPPRHPWETAYAVALASLVADDDPGGPSVVQAAEVVARRLTAAHQEDADVLAWLLLGER
ncbi:MAG TPA: hypothetical protein VLS51_09740, partial [Propionibacteriaceae bacterium]|nr:hypothetical protein [Propionibacteriaceae bacterium]